MAKNKNMHAARKNKNDEFYTQLEDIEQELKHYRKHFEGKVVYLNCDDPEESNFFFYFAASFKFLGLKKLIATSFRNGDSHVIEIDKLEDFNNDGAVSFADVQHLIATVPGIKRKLDGGGDFRSPECVEFLKEADIVVTNPPFSLFREFIAQLMEHDKKFLVLGNLNAITYKEVWPHIQAEKMWVGLDCGNKTFTTPVEGVTQVVRAFWFTNLEHYRRNETLILREEYDPALYPKYDNYDAINVDKVKDIPKDYFGLMGVPITYLQKHCPEQFEIAGLDRPLLEEKTGKVSRFFVDGEEKYARAIIQRRPEQA